MLGALLVVLLILWFLGIIRIPGLVIPNISLFNFNGKPVTLWEILILIMIIWAIEALPSPLRQIAVVLILLWVLNILGFIVISGLSNLITIALVIGVVLALFNRG